ncbi:site-specific integrase [Empedobacter stercoris]|uniref:tyrosine-type recombinase/integrase n=1 Tax=Empedobacter TaxID=59734 RepID=UPI001C8EA024|nr:MULTISPECIES: tyrosine-type recombinase/integrase [Empedobacter]MBY0066478.1 site-specific integrase [Empedobacter falsenii]UWX68218.1 site-specific integrase [Empedobacter stercoris]
MDSETILKTLQNRLKLQRYANNTIKSYCGYAQVFLEQMEKYNRLDEIPISEIELFINTKVTQENISVSYQRSLVGAIKKVFELVENQKIELNYLYPKRKVNKLPTFFSQEEVRNLLNATENLKHKAILTIIYSCGLRLSELINLKIADIKSESNLLLIRQSKGNKDRIVALPDKLLLLLREYYKVYQPKDFLFEGAKGDQYSERSVQLILKNAMSKAGVLSKGSVHTLRHSYATHLIKSGIDVRVVQELLGHNDIRTTMIYTHITDIDKKSTPSPLDFL